MSVSVNVNLVTVAIAAVLVVGGVYLFRKARTA